MSSHGLPAPSCRRGTPTTTRLAVADAGTPILTEARLDFATAEIEDLAMERETPRLRYGDSRARRWMGRRTEKYAMAIALGSVSFAVVVAVVAAWSTLSRAEPIPTLGGAIGATVVVLMFVQLPPWSDRGRQDPGSLRFRPSGTVASACSRGRGRKWHPRPWREDAASSADPNRLAPATSLCARTRNGSRLS